MIGKIRFCNETLTVKEKTYDNNGRVAIVIVGEDGMLWATLSTNLVGQDLPPDCFFVKNYSENEQIVEACKHLFDVVEGKFGQAGHMQVPVWRLKRYVWLMMLSDEPVWAFRSEERADAWLKRCPPVAGYVRKVMVPYKEEVS